MLRKFSLGLVLVTSTAALGQPAPTWVDARVATYAQYFQQTLLSGQPGTVATVEPAFPVTLTANVRFGAIDLPGAPDSISGEVAAWGSLGPRDGRAADADVTQAWAMYRNGALRVKVGRQVTLPGSSRYVRFDGASLGLTVGVLDVEAYGGWVALPRWNQPRGAQILGFLGDGLQNPLLAEAQNRAGQFTLGGRISLALPLEGRVSVGFHEQEDAYGAAFRVLSADASLRPLPWLGAGGRVSVDLQALAPSEARAWLDVSKLTNVPLSVDWVYQKPSLLLPQTSVLAAFGGAAWNEVGAETAVRALQSLTVTGRAAAQFFENAPQPGGRFQLGARWRPWLDGRFMVLGQFSRVLLAPSGYWQARLGGRWEVVPTVAATLDTAVYFYDVPVRGVPTSMTGMLSVEWVARPWLRAMLSTTVMRTPWAAFEVQGLARVVAEFGT
ncbi:MAG: hypothetical protein U0228_19485 [Myxococcaceae bacterium]